MTGELVERNGDGLWVHHDARGADGFGSDGAGVCRYDGARCTRLRP